MKTKMIVPLLCMVGFWVYLWSCTPIQSHSEIPEIHFKKLVFTDSIHPVVGKMGKIALLSFSFIDGDGDLGVIPLLDRDGKEMQYDGVSMVYYTWYTKMPDMTYEPFQFRGSDSEPGPIEQQSKIPWSSVMDKSNAQNKTLKGTILAKLETPIQPEEVDTMRIGFYIVDRARHKSKIEYTPDFSIQNPPDTEITK